MSGDLKIHMLQLVTEKIERMMVMVISWERYDEIVSKTLPFVIDNIQIGNYRLEYCDGTQYNIYDTIGDEIGYILMQKSKNILFIDSIWIAEDKRNTGIGSKIIKELIKLLNAHVIVGMARAGAIKFWVKLGMQCNIKRYVDEDPDLLIPFEIKRECVVGIEN